jgi:hypothetical protein
MKKHSVKLTAWLAAVVLLTLAGFYLYRHLAPRPHRTASGPISAETALLDLFGTRGSAGRVALSGGRVATVWAQQPFRIGPVERVAVLVAIEKEGGDCHGCPATLATAVYRDVDSKDKKRSASQRWELESKTLELGQAGSFGEVGSPKGLEARPIGPGKVVLLVPSFYTNQGFVESGSLLFIYKPPRWINAGYVMRAEDNKGECSEDAKERTAKRLDPCWSYTSALVLEPGKNAAFYDVHVKKHGTYLGKPARNARYIFDGKTYRER